MVKRYSFITYARIIAIALITNSHFDGVYPWPISFGGAPGNALFFMITGFLLIKESNELESIEQWYLKRLKRIYPSMWITTAILCGGGGYYIIDNYSSFLRLFIYPTGFWFIAAILELYLVFYLITKAKVSIKSALYFVIAIYVFKYIRDFKAGQFFVEDNLRVAAGLIAMLIGAIYKENGQLNSKLHGFDNNVINGAASLVSLSLFVFIKFMISKGMLYEIQFATHVFSIVFAYFMLVFFSRYEYRFEKLDEKKLGKALIIVSSSSLEIYMIQRWEIELLKELPFPVNMFLIVLTVLASGVLIHAASDQIVKRIIKVPNRTNGA